MIEMELEVLRQVTSSPLPFCHNPAQVLCVCAMDTINVLQCFSFRHSQSQHPIPSQLRAQVSHPHIIGMSEYFDTPDKLYLVLDYVEGGELFDRIVDEVRLRCIVMAPHRDNSTCFSSTPYCITATRLCPPAHTVFLCFCGGLLARPFTGQLY